MEFLIVPTGILVMRALMKASIAPLVATWLLLILVPVTADAQSTAAPAAPTASRLWLVAGGAWTTLRGDCQTCEEDFPYRHGGGILADAGYRVNERMDVGGELFWVPIETASGYMKGTHVDAVAQFRPWSSQGFFVKGGAGIAFVRNWVDVTGPDAYNQKSFSVVNGGGWVFQPTKRFGLQLFATQHAIALGDLQTSAGTINDVMGNMWSVGAAIVFR
jgi:hypothetical protein